MSEPINLKWEPEFYVIVRDGKVVGYYNAEAYKLTRRESYDSPDSNF